MLLIELQFCKSQGKFNNVMVRITVVDGKREQKTTTCCGVNLNRHVIRLYFFKYI